MTDEQKAALEKLLDHRDIIQASLMSVETILREFFPKEHILAYSHWIPQISTALNGNHDKWLSRGIYGMNNTVDTIREQDVGAGIKKFV